MTYARHAGLLRRLLCLT